MNNAKIYEIMGCFFAGERETLFAKKYFSLPWRFAQQFSSPIPLFKKLWKKRDFIFRIDQKIFHW
ncbi:MAG: hypothetical protein IJ325_08480 [Clostridia bacterium]|nr:hypothetical protein [Clostridia bacterium]